MREWFDVLLIRFRRSWSGARGIVFTKVTSGAPQALLLSTESSRLVYQLFSYDTGRIWGLPNAALVGGVQALAV